MGRSQCYTAVSVFDTRSQAEEVVEELRHAGFRDEQIGMAARRRAPDAADASPRARKGGRALVAGARGALAGIAVSLGILSPAGPVIARGLLADILTGAPSRADGDLVGALQSLGVPEEEAHYYETEFRAGHAIVAVRE